MTDKERYKQLKIENDEKLSTLIDSYHFIGHTYLLKARGYATKNLDTEARIKDVLDELVSFCERGLPAPMAIPNTSEYIEGKVKLLTKASDKNEKVKSIIWTVVIFTIIIASVLFGLWLRKANYLEKPTNIKHTIVDKNIVLEWDSVKGATKGYSIYYIDDTGNKSEIIMVPESQTEKVTYIYESLDITKSYTFYIYANEVTTENTYVELTILLYQSETAEYKYTPGE